MKDSGIEWIGEIPDGWGLYKIGSLFKCRNEKVNDTDYAPLSVSKGGVVPQMENVAKSKANDNRKLVLANDFVINSRSDRKQSCGVSPLDGSVSLINIVLYTEREDMLLVQYANIAMKNYGFAEEFYRWGHGIVADLWTTSWQEMKSIVLPLPTISVQQRILYFLNQKLAEVDKLIDVQQAQVGKLKEYKQSVITEAVTKGLDPAALMKDSGIEWLGAVPENWQLYKLKYAYLVRNEKYVSGNYNYIALENVESMSGKYICTETNANYMLQGSILAKVGDVIFGKLRPYLAKTMVVDEESYVSPEFAVFYSCVNNTAFLKYLFLSASFLDIINSSTCGTKMPRANVDYICNLSIVLPSTIEQQQIAEYLDDKCAKIDKLIALKQVKIEKLNEYKKSLIYEYVTGKKEVV